MASPEETIDVAPGSDLDRLLDKATGADLVLVKNGVRYRLRRDDAEAGEPDRDPGRVLRILDETAGSWRDVDVDRLMADIYRWREEGSRLPDRP